MSLINYERDKRGVATVTLNRPEKLNAFSRALCDEYLETLDTVEADIDRAGVRVVLLAASGERAFCAGADLKERQAMNDAQIDEQLKVQRQMMDRTAALSVPTIALINGVAFGGGLELALACDFRLALTTAQLGLTELNLAIIPGSGGTQRLTRLVGLAYATEMILLAKRLSASEALAVRLVNAVADSFEPVLKTFVDSILATGPLAQRAAKIALNRGLALPLNEALDLERDCYETVLKSHDRVEGLNAFLTKRKPSYQAK